MANEPGKMDRCAVCGKVISPGEEEVFQILKGRMKRRPYCFANPSEWGKMHGSCFVSSIGSPDDFLTHLRKFAGK